MYKSPHSFELSVYAKGDITEENKDQIIQQFIDQLGQQYGDHIKVNSATITPTTYQGESAWLIKINYTVNSPLMPVIGAIIAIGAVIVAIIVSLIVLAWTVKEVAGPAAPIAITAISIGILLGGIAAAIGAFKVFKKKKKKK